jgi:pimeloyl-ACP methyl ester carboxylesterase
MRSGSVFTQISGQSVFYAEAGRGETVLLLHGWGTDHSLFRPLIELLSKKYHVLALDLPGFGQSAEPPNAWDVGDYAAFVQKFLAQKGISVCSILGHSFGGRVAIKIAAAPPPQLTIKKLVLLAAAGIKPPATEKSTARAKRYKRAKRLLESAPMRRFFPGAMEKLRQKYGSADYKAASPHMRKVLVKTVNEDLAPLLSAIKTPTLCVWGRNDTATPLSDGERMTREIPDAGLVILENAGHYAFLEQLPQFLRVMASFFQIT